VGGFFAGFLAGYTSKIGRRQSLILMDIVTSLCIVWLLIALYFKSMFFFILGRFLVGLSSGFAYTLVPLYIKETAPYKI